MMQGAEVKMSGEVLLLARRLHSAIVSASGAHEYAQHKQCTRTSNDVTIALLSLCLPNHTNLYLGTNSGKSDENSHPTC